MIGVFVILLPFIIAFIYGAHSYYTDGDLKKSQIASKLHDINVIAKSPLIAARFTSIQKHLESTFEYYKNLPADDKNKFALRTGNFISNVNFSGKEGF